MQLCCLLNTFATKKIFPHIVTIHLKMLLPFARLFLKIFGVLNDQKKWLICIKVHCHNWELLHRGYRRLQRLSIKISFLLPREYNSIDRSNEFFVRLVLTTSNNNGYFVY